MSKFVSRLNDDSYICIPADQMVMDEPSNMLFVYCGGKLVAMLDPAVVLTAHLSEEKKG